MACKKPSDVSLENPAQPIPCENSGQESSPSFTERLMLSEAAASKAEQELRALKTLLAGDIQSTTSRWIREIDAIMQRRKSTEVIVGIAGATGSGKSTLLNELLMEDSLVPTSPMRACTAAVTKVSHNRDKLPKYKAVITFLSKEAWKAELLPLFDDFRNEVTEEEEKDTSADRSWTDELNVAFAKLKAVYPFIPDRTTLISASIDGLVNHPDIQGFLDEEITIEAETADILADRIKQYIDTRHESEIKDGSKMQYWPIVEQIHIYSPCPILATGVTIVDLPGGSDSNAARNAIAGKYLRKCTALWIAASSVRAMDDGYGRELLEKGIQQQLMRDGTFKNTTFICTKTDQIVVEDVRQMLDDDPKFSKAIGEIDQKTKEHDNKIKFLKQQKKKLERDIEMLRSRIQDSFLQKIHNSALEIEPSVSQTPNFSSSENIEASPPKRIKLDTPSALLENSTLPLSSDVLTNPSSESTRSIRPSDAEDSQWSYHDLDNELQTQEQQLSEIKKLSKDSRKQLQQLGRRERQICVKFRNHCATKAIQENFSNDLEELRQAAEEVNDDVLHSKSSLERDREPKLNVLCVSSIEYRRFRTRGGSARRQTASARSEGFHHEEDTGIPALQEHIQQIGLTATTEANENFINMAQRLITSFNVWSSKVEPETAAINKTQISDQPSSSPLEDLLKALQDVFQKVFTDISGQINSYIVHKLSNAAQLGRVKAKDEAEKWRKNLKWMTYRAVCRRSGRFTGKRGSHDFNEDLTTAFMQKLDTDWDAIFNYEIHRAFQIAGTACDSHFNTFRDRLLQSMEDRGLPEFQKVMFNDQFELFSNSLNCILREADRWFNLEQKQINRVPKAMVQQYMEEIYTACLAQKSSKDKKLIDSMDETMQSGIKRKGREMFDEIQTEIKTRTQKILIDGADKVMVQLKDSCDSFVEDCKHFVSSESRDFGGLSQDVQEQIIARLRRVDVAFQAAKQAQEAIVPVGESGIKKMMEAQQTIVASPDNDGDSDLLRQPVSSGTEIGEASADSSSDGSEDSDDEYEP